MARSASHRIPQNIIPFCAVSQKRQAKPGKRENVHILESIAALGAAEDAPLAQIVRWSYALSKGQEPLERLDVLARNLIVQNVCDVVTEDLRAAMT
jgi:hypothetical protein